MAYGLKHNLYWRPEHHNLTNGAYGIIEIHEKDYAGSVTELELASDFSITREFPGWDNHILGMVLEFSIVNNNEDYFALLDIMTAKERKYFVKVRYAPTGTLDRILFEGYINTQATQQKYLYKSIIRLVASSHLDKLQHTYPPSLNTEEKITLIDLISEILTETGATGDIYTNVWNLHHQESYGTYGQTWLNTTGVLLEVFWENSEERKTSEVILEALLTTFNCYLYWWEGNWYIEHYNMLWDLVVNRSYIYYDMATSYSPSDAGTVTDDQLPVNDVHTLRFIKKSQVLKIQPGDRIISIQYDLSLYDNMIIPDFTTSTPVNTPDPSPDLRKWMHWTGTPSVTWWLTPLGSFQPLSWKGITSGVFRNISSASPFGTPFLHKGGLYTKFKVTYELGVSIDISWKYVAENFETYTKNDNAVAFTGNWEDYEFIFRWYLYCEETGYAITKDPDYPNYEYSLNWKPADGELSILVDTKLDGAEADLKGVFTPNINILLEEVNLWDVFHTQGEDYTFIFSIALEGIKKKDGRGDLFPALQAFIGDPIIKVTSDTQQPNLIEGTINEDFLKKRKIQMLVGDCINVNYKNALLRGTNLELRTTEWEDMRESPSGDLAIEELVDWILYHKFRLYNQPRQRIESDVKDTSILRPFSRFTEQKQNGKKFLLTGYKWTPTTGVYHVQLDEYDHETEVNLTQA